MRQHVMQPLGILLFQVIAGVRVQENLDMETDGHTIVGGCKGPDRNCTGLKAGYVLDLAMRATTGIESSTVSLQDASGNVVVKLDFNYLRKEISRCYMDCSKSARDGGWPVDTTNPLSVSIERRINDLQIRINDVPLPLFTLHGEALIAEKFYVEGFEDVKATVDAVKCTTPCAREECINIKEKEETCTRLGKKYNSSFCFTRDFDRAGRRRGKEDYIGKENNCRLDREPGSSFTCCEGHPHPLPPLRIEKNEWYRVIPSEDIVQKTCKAYRDQSPEIAKKLNLTICMEMTGERVKIVDKDETTFIFKVWSPVMGEVYMPSGTITWMKPPALGQGQMTYHTYKFSGKSKTGITINKYNRLITWVGEEGQAGKLGVRPHEFVYGVKESSILYQWTDYHYRKYYDGKKNFELVVADLDSPFENCVDFKQRRWWGGMRIWKDKNRFTCGDYEQKNWCTVTGLPTKAWKEREFWFWQRDTSFQGRAKRNRRSALGACCACGGGWANARIAETPKPPTFSDTPPDIVSVTWTTTAKTTAPPRETTNPATGLGPKCTKNSCSLSKVVDNDKLGQECSGECEDFCCETACKSFKDDNLCSPPYYVYDDAEHQTPVENPSAASVKCCKFNQQVINDEESLECSSCPALAGRQRAVTFNLTFQNLVYTKLTSNWALMSQFNRTVAKSVSLTIGPRFKQDQVNMQLSPGSVIANVFIIFPHDETPEKSYEHYLALKPSLEDVDALRETLQDNLPDLSEAAAGTVTIDIGKTISVVKLESVGFEGDDRDAYRVPGAAGSFTDPIVHLLGGEGFAVLFGVGSVVLVLLACLFLFAPKVSFDEDDDLNSVTQGSATKADNRPAANLASALHDQSSHVSGTAGGSTAVVSAVGATSQVASTIAPSRIGKAEKVVPPQIDVKLCGESQYAYTHSHEPARAQQLYGDWSSDYLTMGDDMASFGCAVVCFPFFYPWRIHQNIDRVGSVQGPTGKIDLNGAWLWSWAIMFVFVLSFVLLFNEYSCTFWSAGLACSTFAWNSDDAGKGLLTAFLFFLLCPMYYRLYIMQKAIATRFQIEEDDSLVAAKTILCPVLASLQSGRQVDTYYQERGIKPPKLPLIGVSVKVKGLPDVARDSAHMDGADQPRTNETTPEDKENAKA